MALLNQFCICAFLCLVSTSFVTANRGRRVGGFGDEKKATEEIQFLADKVCFFCWLFLRNSSLS